MIRLSLFIAAILFCQFATGEICGICREEMDDTKKSETLCCSHKYHSHCLYLWAAVKSICPMCRGDIFFHREVYICTEHDLCSKLHVEGLGIHNIHKTHNIHEDFKSVTKELQRALQKMATANYYQFVIAEELEKQKQIRIKKQKELEKQAMIIKVMDLCEQVKALSINDTEYDNADNDTEYDNAESMEF